MLFVPIDAGSQLLVAVFTGTNSVNPALKHRSCHWMEGVKIAWLFILRPLHYCVILKPFSRPMKALLQVLLEHWLHCTTVSSYVVTHQELYIRTQNEPLYCFVSLFANLNLCP